jgi:hypothetical protein
MLTHVFKFKKIGNSISTRKNNVMITKKYTAQKLLIKLMVAFHSNVIIWSNEQLLLNSHWVPIIEVFFYIKK